MSIEENIVNRQAAEDLADAMAAYVGSELESIARPECFWAKFDELTRPDLHEACSVPLLSAGVPIGPIGPVPADIMPTTENDEVDELLDEIYELAEQVPPECENAESMLDTARDIGNSVEAQGGYASENQLGALRNIRNGLQKWVD